LIVNVSKVNY